LSECLVEDDDNILPVSECDLLSLKLDPLELEGYPHFISDIFDGDVLDLQQLKRISEEERELEEDRLLDKVLEENTDMDQLATLDELTTSLLDSPDSPRQGLKRPAESSALLRPPDKKLSHFFEQPDQAATCEDWIL